MIAKDIFNTEKPISARGRSTFKAIAARLAAFHPPIFLDGHIAEVASETDSRKKHLAQFAIPGIIQALSEAESRKSKYSTLLAADSTLDGVSFIANEPKLLAKAFYSVKDSWGNVALASLQEDPDHWPLKASFGRTVGTGWRESWRPPTYSSLAIEPETKFMNDSLRMRFGNAGTRLPFTALHCAVDEKSGQCNIHIDESGFVLALPSGISLTPDFYGHFMNELLFKTEFRDWLVGLMPNPTAALIVKEVIRRISFQFPTAYSGYAGLDSKIRSLHRPTGIMDAVSTTIGFIAPIGVTIDIFDRDNFKVQATGTFGAGDLSISITIGGLL